MPDVIVRDKGDPTHTVECRVIVRLFDTDHVVELILANSYESLIDKVEVFEAILGDILKDKNVADFYVVDIVRINKT